MTDNDQKTKKPTARLADKALELVMRDVLGGMSELANIAGYHPTPCEFEILHPRPTTGRVPPGETARIIPYPGKSRYDAADMVEFLTRRELSTATGR